METINALHDAFKDAESDLEAAKDRLSCLTSELGQYQLFEEKMAGEEDSVERTISNSERELLKERQVLCELKAASSISQVQLEILDRQHDESPRVLLAMVGRLLSRHADEISCVERIQKEADDVMSQKSVTADNFTQARDVRKMLYEDRRRSQEKLLGELQAALLEDTDTLQLLRACIDGMIKKNELLRDREEEVAALYGCPAPSSCEHTQDPFIAPHSRAPVDHSAARKKRNDCQRSHSTAALSQQQPHRSPATPRHVMHQQQQLPPQSASAPWYKFNKKLHQEQEQVFSHSCSSTHTSTSTTVVTPHTVMTTNEEAFHSATELLELLDDEE